MFSANETHKKAELAAGAPGLLKEPLNAAEDK